MREFMRTRGRLVTHARASAHARETSRMRELIRKPGSLFANEGPSTFAQESLAHAQTPAQA